MLCAGLTVYSALRRSAAQQGQWLVVLGAGGGLGHLAVQLGSSKEMGLRVIGVDSREKEKLVRACGAEHFVDIGAFASGGLSSKDDGIRANGHHDDSEEVMTHHGNDRLAQEITGLCDEGLGAHAVLVCAASNDAYALASKILRFGGTMVCVGLPEGEDKPIAMLSPGNMVTNMWHITGSAVGSSEEAVDALQLAAKGAMTAQVQVEKMDALTQVFQAMHEHKLLGRVVLDLS